jgi:hypothetical protein
MAAVPTSERARVDAMLDTVPIHRWHRVWTNAGAAANVGAKVELITALASLWDGSGAEHVVVRPGAVDGHPIGGRVSTYALGNGTTALVVG